MVHRARWRSRYGPLVVGEFGPVQSSLAWRYRRSFNPTGVFIRVSNLSCQWTVTVTPDGPDSGESGRSPVVPRYSLYVFVLQRSYSPSGLPVGNENLYWIQSGECSSYWDAMLALVFLPPFSSSHNVSCIFLPSCLQVHTFPCPASQSPRVHLASLPPNVVHCPDSHWHRRN